MRNAVKRNKLIGALVTVLVGFTVQASAELKAGLLACELGNWEAARVELESFASNGVPEAQYCMGKIYAEGFSVQKDKTRAVALLKAAEEQWRSLAEQGDRDGQYYIGVMYEEGYGVDKDNNQAIDWFTKSAHQGHAKAAWHLGLIYQLEGHTLAADTQSMERALGKYSEAARWFQKGAERGNFRSQQSLALHYARGLGLPPDNVLALKWFTIVDRRMADEMGPYEQGFRRVFAPSIVIERMKQQMSPDEVREGETLADEWLEAWQARKPAAR